MNKYHDPGNHTPNVTPNMCWLRNVQGTGIRGLGSVYSSGYGAQFGISFAHRDATFRAISGKDSAVGNGLGSRIWSFSVASEAFKLLGCRLMNSAVFDHDAKSNLILDFEIVKSDAHIRAFLCFQYEKLQVGTRRLSVPNKHGWPAWARHACIPS